MLATVFFNPLQKLMATLDDCGMLGIIVRGVKKGCKNKSFPE